MREILFRGKRKVCDEWVYGFPFISRKGEYKIKWYDGYYGSSKTSEIYTESIGQFTGLTDKNGKKIFEGDVVKAVIVRDLGGGTENRQETGIIAYDKIGMIGLVAKYDGSIPIWSDFFQELTLSGCINDFWFEIIGNIHDNPELLENP